MTSNFTHINLIPDIKAERIKQQQREQWARLISIVVIAAVVAITLIAVMAAYAWQRSQLVNTQEAIDDERAAIAAIEEQDELVGMQTALLTLPELSQERLVVSELPQILEAVVPDSVVLTYFEYQSGGDFELVAESRTYADFYELVDAMENVQGAIDDGQNNDEEPEQSEFFTNVELVDVSDSEDEITFMVEGTMDEMFLQMQESVAGDNDG